MPTKRAHRQVAGNVHADGLIRNQHIHFLNIAHVAQRGSNGETGSIQGFVFQNQCGRGKIHCAHASCHFHRILSVKGQASLSTKGLHRVIPIIAKECLHNGLGRVSIMAECDGHIAAQEALPVRAGQE